MNLAERVKKILITPHTEWLVIKTENASVQEILVKYIIPLSLVPASFAVLSGIIWHSVIIGIGNALAAVTGAIIGFYAATYITDAFAPTFSSEKDLNRSAQLVGYAYTPYAIASILVIIPLLNLFTVIAGFGYMTYLLYIGVAPIKKTPDEKRVAYVILILLIQLILYFSLTTLFTSTLFRNYYTY